MTIDNRDHFPVVANDDEHDDGIVPWPWWQCILFWFLMLACVAGGFVIGVEILVRL